MSESDDTVCPVAHLLIHAATVEAKSASERTHDAEVLAHTTRLIRADAHVTGFVTHIFCTCVSCIHTDTRLYFHSD